MSPAQARGQKLLAAGAVEECGSGAEVVLSDGRAVVDFGSYGVGLLGHRHPEVVAAVAGELARMTTSTRVLANPRTAALAERLVGLLAPERLPRVWIGQSGADAVECALKLARVASGRPRMLAVEGAFHGKTLGALSATYWPRYRSGLEQFLAPTTHLDPADPDAAARELARGDVAGLVFEPVQGEGGVRVLDAAVLRRWSEDVRAAGGFVVSDEVQAGLFRAGPASLALQWGLEVDAVLFGKHLGGGVLPLSAAVCSERLYAPLAADAFLHTSTFGGHPLSCAAGLAAIDVTQRLADVTGLPEQMEAALQAVRRRHPDVVTAVRGQGLLWGLEMSSPATAGSALVDLTEQGLLVSPCLGRPEVLRLLPPLVTTPAQLRRAIEALDAALAVAESYVDLPDPQPRKG
ncbi:aspartate aminotransferase family protein [Motilibacter sp. E257]|uniref:Aspartate aminotransferase family protein n=2 Tax=Motilibacter deserti TaxID=2714956 RepID=A0ABX0H229_9ACTN|nr:aspartate aminotransferase family protein [Motilibacter deserti]NHC16104.1 aspartate aminotransferase family protein [Motilibacter deserti]